MPEPSTTHEDFRPRLRRANAQQLLQLIATHGRELTLGDVRQILRNPYVTSQAIDELLCVRQLLTIYEVRSAIARHCRTSQTAALRFVSGLFWRDLLELAADMRIAPAVRRVAEKYLIRRLSRLATGEKVAIARRGTPEVIAHLRSDANLLVVKALLDNPRLTEESLLPILVNMKTGPRVLDLIAKSTRWGSRYGVRVALSRHPLAPFRVLFEILPGLRRRDLIAVAEKEAHSSVVRHRARELLDGSARRTPEPK